MGLNSSSTILDGFEDLPAAGAAVDATPEDSASNLLRPDEALGENKWESSPQLKLDGDSTGWVWLVDSEHAAQEMGSSSSSDAQLIKDDDPGRTCQKPTGDLERALNDAMEDASLDDSEIDLSRPNNEPSLSIL